MERWLQSTLRERPQYNTSGSTSRSSTSSSSSSSTKQQTSSSTKHSDVQVPSKTVLGTTPERGSERGANEVRRRPSKFHELYCLSRWRNTWKLTHEHLPCMWKRMIGMMTSTTTLRNLITSHHLTSPAIRTEHECITASASGRPFCKHVQYHNFNMEAQLTATSSEFWIWTTLQLTQAFYLNRCWIFTSFSLFFHRYFTPTTVQTRCISQFQHGPAAKRVLARLLGRHFRN